MRVTSEVDIHVHHLSCRAMARPQVTWYDTLWIAGNEGALLWDGDGSAVTYARSADARLPGAAPRDRTGPATSTMRAAAA